MEISPTEWFGGAKRLLFVHAHPDDESIFTGGVIAGLTATGREVAVLTLTRGERGEVVAGPLSELEGTGELATQRSRELAAALEALGVTHSAFLGSAPARTVGQTERRYEDSGMQWGAGGQAVAAADVGAAALTRAEVAEALADMIAYADAFGADALVSYDENGGYGHPDHVFAHRLARSVAIGLDIPFWEATNSGQDAETYDVSEWLETKKLALAAHATQLRVSGSTLEMSGGQVHEIAPRESFALVQQ